MPSPADPSPTPNLPWSARLQAAWLTRGPLACALLPVAALYGLLLALRNALYRLGLRKVWRAPVPVLVVGNVVAGGAGKTPTVMALVAHFQQRGLVVGVVSRGWGRASEACLQVRADSLPQEVGDEPLLMHQRTGAPVFVARQRADAVRALLAACPDTQLVICDDGLQHSALARDVEVLVFDERGTGNGWLLPAGPLREPWPRKSDASSTLVLHTGGQAAPGIPGFSAQRRLADHAVARDGSRVALASLAGQPLHALAGIARPEAFFAMLQGRGLTLARCEPLPDHYDFDSWTASPGADFQLICTEKDALKLWPHAPSALAVPLELLPEPGFTAAVDAAVDAAIASAPASATIRATASPSSSAASSA